MTYAEETLPYKHYQRVRGNTLSPLMVLAVPQDLIRNEKQLYRALYSKLWKLPMDKVN